MNKKKLTILMSVIFLIILGYFCFTYYIKEEKERIENRERMEIQSGIPIPD